MKCPKCGGEIPFYDLKPNCKHCGVNIMYYTQEEGLVRDAKRTELESAVARMVIARVKAAFIGSKLAIARMIAVIVSVTALLIPFGGVRFSVPFFDHSFSVGLIGLIGSFTNGFAMKLPLFLKSGLFSKATVAAIVPTAFLLVILILDLVLLVMLLLSFLNLTRSAVRMRNLSLVGAVVAFLGQIAVLVMKFTAEKTDSAVISLGFGSIAACAVFLVLFFLNRAMLNKGIEPTYRENDLKRKELLRQVRAGEVDLDSLPLPIFESDEERSERMKQLEEALKAEEEGKEL